MLQPQQTRPQALFEPQRMAAVRIILEMPPEQVVPGLAVAGDGPGIVLVHLEPHRHAVGGDGRVFAGGEQR